MRLRGEVSSAREQNIIERQVNHLIHLVDDLLDISRITRGKVELERKPQRVRAIVAKAVEVVTPILNDRGHRLTVATPDEDLWIEADELRIVQVLTNLLTNAAKYTNRGGQIELFAGREGDHVIMRVRDNGAGIS